MSESAAVDVERFENLDERVGIDAPIECPADDIEVFLSGFDAIENAVEKEGVIVEGTLQEAKVATVEFDPETPALKMLQPAGSQIAPPVFLHPATNGGFTQVAPGFLTLDPFIALDLLLTFNVNTGFANFGFYTATGLLHGPNSLTCSALAATLPSIRPDDLSEFLKNYPTFISWLGQAVSPANFGGIMNSGTHAILATPAWAQLRAVLDGGTVLVIGKPGRAKTSLVRSLDEQLAGEGQPDSADYTGSSALLKEASERLRDKPLFCVLPQCRYHKVHGAKTHVAELHLSQHRERRGTGSCVESWQRDWDC
jgi:hypothetical protein